MLKKIQKIALVILVVYAVFGFLILPFLLQKELVSLVKEQTTAQLEIEKIYFNPFSFKLNIDNVKLKNADNSDLFTLKSLTCNLEVHSLLKPAIHIKNFLLDQPEVWVVLNKDKSLNFTSIVKQTPSNEKIEDDNTTTELPRIILNNILVREGRVNYKDFTHENRFDFSLSNLAFELQNIDTHDYNASNGEVKFYSALSDGGVISLNNKILGFKPLVLQGKLKLVSNKLYTGWKYMQDSLNLEVANGEFSFDTDYYIDLDDLNTTKLSNISATIKNLRVKPKNSAKDILTLNGFSLNDATIEPFKREVKIDDITFDSLSIAAQENKNGVIDWSEYTQNPNQEIKKDEDTNSTSEAWRVSLNTLNLKNTKANFNTQTVDKKAFSKINNIQLHIPTLLFTNLNLNTKEESTQSLRAMLKEVALNSASITFEDDALSPVTTNKIDEININLHNLDTKAQSRFNYDISLRVNEGGHATTTGSVCITPLEQNGTIALDKISLKELTPYIQKSAFAKIDSGYLSLKADTAYEVSATKPDLKLQGSINIEDFSLSNSKNRSKLLSFKDITLKSLDYEMSPDKLFIKQIDINSPYLNAIVYKNKSMNLSSLMKDEKHPSKKSKTTSNTPFAMKIDKVKVSGGRAYFADLSLPIKFRTNIHSINGVIYPVSTAKNIKSRVNIKGKVDKYGATTLKGTLNPSNPKEYTSLNLNFKNLDLKSASGYSASFAGYKIDNGKLFLDLTYDIKKSQLLSTNDIVIKKIELGDEFKDENTSSLPLGLVIALLEDKDGVIDIGMPIEGDIDAPDFKYGALVWKTLGNLILKAAASPFNFLSSMLGLDANELENVTFEGGSSEILPTEQEQLDKVAELLQKRPKLALNISGAYDAEVDKLAIGKIKLLALAIKESDAQTDEEKANALSIDYLEDFYDDKKDDDKIDAIKDALEEKFENDEEFESAYLDALINECAALLPVSNEELLALAKQRSGAIKKYLVEIKNIDSGKINEIEPRETSDSEGNLVKSKLEVTVK